MTAMIMTQVDEQPAFVQPDISWGILWRGLVVGICCVLGGALTGMVLGFAVTLSHSGFHLLSWTDAFMRFSEIFGEPLMVLPL